MGPATLHEAAQARGGGGAVCAFALRGVSFYACVCAHACARGLCACVGPLVHVLQEELRVQPRLRVCGYLAVDRYEPVLDAAAPLLLTPLLPLLPLLPRRRLCRLCRPLRLAQVLQQAQVFVLLRHLALHHVGVQARLRLHLSELVDVCRGLAPYGLPRALLLPRAGDRQRPAGRVAEWFMRLHVL
eukprot:CAMPEP_0173314982 /NCGR_PEP_ID=MMETSP1143-20121109/25644_1 /TAXON_ID=483371 /ORGANISM="non described non described, Strain CCMP2298" /LENGTH=185 /DNA_ID=CAMNT_0014257657 /DNA_START=331 /DNA_END=887 /DNA_ORIENTATION=+